MNFAFANKAPIGVTIEGVAYQLPRFVRRDWVKWASEVDGERVAQATANLSPDTRAKFLLIWPVQPVDHSELARRVHTTEGTGRIVGTCAERGGVPKEVVERLLEDGDEKDLETLAMMLASIVDPETLLRQVQKAKDEKQEQGGESPLPSAGNASNG